MWRLAGVGGRVPRLELFAAVTVHEQQAAALHGDRLCREVPKRAGLVGEPDREGRADHLQPGVPARRQQLAHHTLLFGAVGDREPVPLVGTNHRDVLQRRLKELPYRDPEHAGQSAERMQRRVAPPPLQGGDQPEADLGPAGELLHRQPQALTPGPHGPPHSLHRDLVIAEWCHGVIVPCHRSSSR